MNTINLRRITSILSCIIIMMSMTSSIYAKETNTIENGNITNVECLDDGTIATTYEFDISEEDFGEDGSVIMPFTTNVTSSFTLSGSYHRGGDRVYEGNYLTYQITVTDANGKAINQTVTLQLWDYNHSYALHENTVKADTLTHKVANISITDNRTHYFKYYNNGSKSLKIKMVISSKY